VNAWVAESGAAAPAPLRGWGPMTEANLSGRWLIDADMADEAFGQGQRPPDAVTVESGALDAERALLAEERAVFDLERRVFEGSRIEQLENEVARLRVDNEKLSSQVSKLGGVIRDLTETAHA